jgi:DNA-binding ferritin-like protein (Dps family)
MSYLQSYEYKDGKDQLFGEYKEKFQMIETYYIQLYTEGSYEIQITLSQILNDFLQAQIDQKPLEKIIGKDIKNYALLMLEAENDREKGKNTIKTMINTALVFIWLLLFLVFCNTFSFSQFKHDTFYEKINHIYFSIFEIILVFIACTCELIRMRAAKALFYHPKLLYFLRLLSILPFTFLMNFYFNKKELPKTKLSILVPGMPFLILFLLLTIYLIILGYLGYKKTSSKKNQLKETSDNLTPEQVVCPACNQSHDYDYPKCPHCGYKVTQ